MIPLRLFSISLTKHFVLILIIIFLLYYFCFILISELFLPVHIYSTSFFSLIPLRFSFILQVYFYQRTLSILIPFILFSPSPYLAIRYFPFLHILIIEFSFMISLLLSILQTSFPREFKFIVPFLLTYSACP